MRKIFFILISILIAGSIIGFITIKNQSSSTVVSAIERSGSKVNQIVSAKDYYDGKVIVFTDGSINSKGFSLNHAYVKRTLFGWKCIDTTFGGHGGSSELSSGYYSLNDKIRLITGYVADNNISKVEIKVNDKIINPELISINGIRLWALYLDNNLSIKSINVIGKTENHNVIRDLNLSEFISI
ncbi:hypothetical protein [Clostridium folliculivorans]|uniref:Uncharacterized protein n=1 Tax=Clostridium folliculivorans TaxID=2886038 RepID=A0A9W5Y1V7_9CLOT|nr:hypothetical protein [Clostridium folliculivorans]GKU24957.1 hypothetical protein CFOLD11_17830 [Clostridium folliculivorans]GKU31055.1 hypothetical protein CFB3_31620 [Clostridium folliculivorans]